MAPALRLLCRPAGVVVLLALAGCSGPNPGFQATLADYKDDIARLERDLQRDPGDAEALRDLGVIYMHLRNYPRGYEYLRDAYPRRSDDPQVLYYLGLANELLGRPQTALSLYAQHPDVARTSPYRSRMAARYKLLAQRAAREEMQRRLATPDTLASVTPDASIIAVYPLQYVGRDSSYASLGRGVAELMSADLANVPTLRVIERVRVQTLLDELDFSQSQAVDPTSAPRMGRLLGAGRLVGGTFSVTEGNRAQIDVALSSVERGTVSPLLSAAEPLGNFFTLQKAIVFAIIDSLGIELTPVQMERIQRMPTQNLEAFLAYSRGLEREDAGDLRGAAALYQQAAQLDPGFTGAQVRYDDAQGAAVTPASPEEALAEALDLRDLGTPTIDPMDNRTERLNETLNVHFVPGADSRNPAIQADPEPLLPLPPPPPPRGN